MSVEYIQAKIRGFQRRFNHLKRASKECLEKRNVSVSSVADCLTSLPTDDLEEHEHFLSSHMSSLFQAADHSELFGTMTFHWNYLSYNLLDYLIQEFNLEKVKGEMETYKADLQQFRIKTPLELFCQSQKRRRVRPPTEFLRVVLRFWQHGGTFISLETVEQFRLEYASHYSLMDCAVMLCDILAG